MKIQIEIPDKYLRAAASLVSVTCVDAVNEEKVEEVVKSMKGGTFDIDVNGIGESDNVSSICLGLAMIAIGQELERRDSEKGS